LKPEAVSREIPLYPNDLIDRLGCNRHFGTAPIYPTEEQAFGPFLQHQMRVLLGVMREEFGSSICRFQYFERCRISSGRFSQFSIGL